MLKHHSLNSSAANYLLLARESAREPIETLVESITCGCTSRLDEPLPVPKVVEPKLVRHLRSGHCIWQVLLVGKDEYNSIAHLILIQHLCQLFTCVLNAIAIVAVDNKDESLRVLVVVTPEWADLVLAANVPDCEADVFVLNCLDIEANRGDRGHNFPELQLVQDGCFTSGIKANHQDSHLLVAEHMSP